MPEPQLVYEVWLSYLPPHGYRGRKSWENHYVAWMTERQARRVEGWIKSALRGSVLNMGKIREIGYPSSAEQFLDDFKKDNDGLVGFGPKDWRPLP